MAPNGSGCSRSTSGTAGRGVKRTPWTSTEDNILRKYVKEHGEGNWGLIQKKSGLNKSGKSCRNRWSNYLRPNLKKGAFSAKEEEIVIALHGKLGNKWARIAAKLPNRTDNEVKNYWNIRLKKCQRLGFGIHPQEMSQINHPLDSSPSPTFSSLLDSFQPQDPNLICSSNSVISPSLNDPLPKNMLDKSSSANDLTFAQDSNGSMALPLMPSNVIATPNNGAGDSVAMESEFMQVLENKKFTDGVRPLDEEFWRLLDAPSSLPIPEWDDLDPSDSSC